MMAIPFKERHIIFRRRFPIEIAIVIVLLALLCLGGFGRQLFQKPDVDRFLALYFKEPFVAFILLLILWFTASQQTAASRMEEYAFLGSLPIEPSNICIHFMILDFWRFSWVPLATVILYAGLRSVSPVSYLCRLGFTAFQGFILSIVLNSAGQWAASLHARSRVSKYPDKNEPAIVAGSIICYASLQWIFLLLPSLPSGYLFWVTSCILWIGIFLGARIARIYFRRWNHNHRIHLAPSLKPSRHPWIGQNFLNSVSVKMNPMLSSALIRSVRKRRTGTFLLTLLFIMLAYMVSMNNKNPHDQIAVLIALVAIYSYLFSFHLIGHFSEEDPPKIVYVMPIKKSALYFSVLFIALGQMVMIASFFAVFILASNRSVGLAGGFWLKSVIAILIFLLPAVNSAVSAYPDPKAGQNKFVLWTFSFMILSAVFFKYHWAVIGLMVLASFYRLKKVRLFQVCIPFNHR